MKAANRYIFGIFRIDSRWFPIFLEKDPCDPLLELSPAEDESTGCHCYQRLMWIGKHWPLEKWPQARPLIVPGGMELNINMDRRKQKVD